MEHLDFPLATYYYDVYYDNDDYYQPITKVARDLKSGDYVKTESINVYEKNIQPVVELLSNRRIVYNWNKLNG